MNTHLYIAENNNVEKKFSINFGRQLSEDGKNNAGS